MSLTLMEDSVTLLAPQEDLYHEHIHSEKENDPDKVEK